MGKKNNKKKLRKKSRKSLEIQKIKKKYSFLLQGPALIRTGQKTFFYKSGWARKFWTALIGRARQKTKQKRQKTKRQKTL